MVPLVYLIPFCMVAFPATFMLGHLHGRWTKRRDSLFRAMRDAADADKDDD